ncbi:MAG TPA: thioredoxin-like domain-containing protein [Mucilaginibacter sp.]|jgi:thiol-disulfide isomerase/thioredoxin
MKKLLLFFCFIISATCTFAQTQPQPKPFVPPVAIPPYHILNTDSVYVTPANLKKNKPVMIIYFAPDCSHCKNFMFEMKPHMDELKNVQVVMISFVLQLKAIQTFYNDFNLKSYPNFTVGTEGYTYVVQRYYEVKTTPYIAIYGKDGKLVKAIDKSPNVDDVLATIKKIKS